MQKVAHSLNIQSISSSELASEERLVSHLSTFFTVAITTYNRADLLGRAIQSVLAQNFTDYELLIVDDASSDRTEEVVKEFATQNVRYVRLPTNSGIGPTRNEVLQHAHGEYIVFLDDDDRFTPDFLKEVHHSLLHMPAAVVFAVPGRHILRPSESGDIVLRKISYNYSSPSVLPGQEFLQNTVGGGSGLVVRTSAAHAIGGFRTDFPTSSDIDFMLRLAAHGDCLVIPNAILLVYNLPRPQITHNRVGIGVAYERLGDVNASILRRFPWAHMSYYRAAARVFYSVGDRLQGRRCLWKAIKVVPWSYKVWCQFVLLELSSFLPLSLRNRLFNISRHDYELTAPMGKRLLQ